MFGMKCDRAIGVQQRLLRHQAPPRVTTCRRAQLEIGLC